MSGALLVTTTEGKLSVFESEYAPCLTAPLAFGCLALKIWGRQAACCLALPEPAASAAVETGIVDQWSQGGTGSASSSCTRLHSNTSGDTQLQKGESCYISDGPRLPQVSSYESQQVRRRGKTYKDHNTRSKLWNKCLKYVTLNVRFIIIVINKSHQTETADWNKLLQRQTIDRCTWIRWRLRLRPASEQQEKQVKSLISLPASLWHMGKISICMRKLLTGEKFTAYFPLAFEIPTVEQ